MLIQCARLMIFLAAVEDPACLPYQAPGSEFTSQDCKSWRFDWCIWKVFVLNLRKSERQSSYVAINPKLQLQQYDTGKGLL